MVARFLVLASGEGTLLQAIIDSSLRPGLVAVGSDICSARALDRATSAGVPTFCKPLEDVGTRDEWNRGLLEAVREWSPDWVVCAGFMRILGPEFVRAFPRRIVNTHPALLPAFPGAHAVRDALAHGVKVSGCSVHLVDEGVDTGDILAQEAVPVLEADDETALHTRIKHVERRLLVTALERIMEGTP